MQECLTIGIAKTSAYHGALLVYVALAILSKEWAFALIRVIIRYHEIMGTGETLLSCVRLTAECIHAYNGIDYSLAVC